jgi:hypothetical protein
VPRPVDVTAAVRSSTCGGAAGTSRGRAVTDSVDRLVCNSSAGFRVGAFTSIPISAGSSVGSSSHTPAPLAAAAAPAAAGGAGGQASLPLALGLEFSYLARKILRTEEFALLFVNTLALLENEDELNTTWL